MAISVSCPSCERELKVKDELAGRKVKCPKCGEGVRVPAEDEIAENAAAAPPPKKRRPQEQNEAEDRPRKKKQPEQDEAEDRPRKKKQKQQDSKLPLILLAGGGVLLVGIVILVVVLVSSGGKKTPKGNGPVVGPVKQNPKGEEAVNNPASDKEVMNDLKMIVMAVNNYWLDTKGSKGPKKADDLDRYLEGPDSRPARALHAGKYDVAWGLAPRLFTKLDREVQEQLIITWEKAVPTKGGYVGMYIYSKVKKMTPAEFEAAPWPTKSKKSP